MTETEHPYEIVWDGYGLDNPFTGIYQHAFQIHIQLAKLNIHPYLVLNTGKGDLWPSAGDHLIRKPVESKLINNKIIWPFLPALEAKKISKKTGKKVILHGLSNINSPILCFKSLKRVITIHDLIPLLSKKSVSRAYYLQFKFAISKVVNRADKIVCVSDWTSQLLTEFFPEFSQKVTVIKNGISPIKKADSNKLSDPDKRTILFVSRYESYKGFPLLAELIKISDSNFHFNIITDERGETFLKSKLDFESFNKTSIFVGLSEKEKLEKYSNSDVMVFPSQYEGYGLPAVEATSFLMPVVYMGGSGINEAVVQDTCIEMQTSHTPGEWLDAIQEILKISKKSVYIDSYKEGVKKKQTWKQSAKKLKMLYDQIAQ